MEPLVVGVWHENDGSRLLDEGCRKAFTERVLPVVDRKTLLVLEGDYDRHAPRRAKYNPLYWYELMHARRMLGVPIGMPFITCKDGRHISGNFKEAMDTLMADTTRYIDPSIALPEGSPATFEAICQAMRTNSVRYDICAEVYDERALIRHCSEMLRLHELCDWPMVDTARNWADGGGQAIILCGCLHALTIHRKTGWPTIALREDGAAMRELLVNIIACVLYPEKVLDIRI